MAASERPSCSTGEPETDEERELTMGINEVTIADSPQNGLSESDTNGNEEPTELPNILIVTNVDDSVFEDPEAKEAFESLFCQYDPTATFHYLKSFRRARVIYSESTVAAQARIEINEMNFGQKVLKCYFAQPSMVASNCPHLQPPQPSKQFLISPPASPPVGWEPCPEGKPIINYDLLSAITNLAPGEAHELHPPSEDKGHPGIFVHVCEDPEGYENRPMILQTRRPDIS